MREYRIDTLPIRDVKENDYGFVTVEVALTRTGVMPYKREDGGIQRELKHPDTIFSDGTMESAKGVPVTDGHPLPLVTAENWKAFTKGTTHLQVKKEDNLLVGYETIFDEELSAYVLSGKKDQVSIGFEADIVEESGMFEGEQYDAVQKNIKINHLAHTIKGRAGEEVRARVGDSAEGFDKPFMMSVPRIDGSNADPVVIKDNIPQNPPNYGTSQAEWEDITFKLEAFRDMSLSRKREVVSYYAWTKSSDVNELTNKNSDMKFPHHNLNGNVNLDAVQTAMSMLSRADISQNDKKSVYQHLANHLRVDFNQEPPTQTEAITTDTNKEVDEDMKTITIDGKEYEVAEVVADTIEKLKEEQVSDEDLTEVELGDETFEVTDEVASHIETLKGKLDGKEDTITNLQGEVEDLKEDMEDVKNDSGKEIKQLLSIMDTAKQYVGDAVEDIVEDDSLDIDESIREIKEAVISSVYDSVDLEEKSDEYVDARYDACIDDLERIYGDSQAPQNNLKNFNQNREDTKQDKELQEKRDARLNLKE